MGLLRREKYTYVLASSLATLVLALAAALIYAHTAASPIPSNVRKQLTFTPFIAASTDAFAVDQVSHYTYDTSNQTLRFTLQSKATGTLTVSEQPTPPQFIDIDSYYTKLVDTLNRYSAFDSQFGTVYLTKPSTLPNGQMAIMNADGVLVFVRSEKDLNDDTWRQIFTTLNLDKDK